MRLPTLAIVDNVGKEWCVGLAWYLLQVVSDVTSIATAHTCYTRAEDCYIAVIKS